MITNRTIERNQGGEDRNGRLTCFVRASENNTHITLSWAEEDREALSQLHGSTGMAGFTGSKRGTAYAAEELTRRLRQSVQTHRPDLHRVSLVLSGFGKGRRAVSKILTDLGYHIEVVSDATPRPHNGCRPKKPRRV